ncbi:MAG: PAS domain-containing sensor histidine kinase [Spirochaetaceae bacterium]|nr:PAS domain-containing sensor histidine kinase [Spirochaetaceae bacterium]
MLTDNSHPDFNFLFRTIVLNSQAINYILDKDGVFLLSEGRALESLGLNPGQVVGTNALEMYALFPDVVTMLKRSLAGESCRGVFEVNGVFFDNLMNPLFDDDGNVEFVIGISTDITARVLYAEKLETSERQFRSIIESSPTGVHVYELDDQGRLILKAANRTSDAMLGIQTSEKIGKSIEEAFPLLVDTEIPRRYLEAARDGVDWHTEQIDYDDERISGAFDVYAFQIRPGAMAAFFLEITEQIRSREEIRKLNENLEEKVRERTRDLEEARDKLVESEKMSSLGRLVAGVAHEINTPVGVCKTGISYIEELVQSLRDRFNNDELTLEDFNETLDSLAESAASSHKSIDQAASLIRSFKNVAVDQTRSASRQFSLKAYIEEVLLSLHNRLKTTSCDIVLECPEDLIVETDPGAIFQIVTNLVLNTLAHGLNDGVCGTILINITKRRNRIRMIYSDDGPGLDEEGRRSIFEPFYTTKRDIGGTGLGMHIVYNLVTQTLHGEISCPESPDRGFLCVINF